MNLPVLNNTNELLDEISENDIYNSLLLQLQKDFLLIGLNFEIDSLENPTELFDYLLSVVNLLITTKINDFLNLLYRIDISEFKIKKIIESNSLTIDKEISFLILKREWTKVRKTRRRSKKLKTKKQHKTMPLQLELSLLKT